MPLTANYRNKGWKLVAVATEQCVAALTALTAALEAVYTQRPAFWDKEAGDAWVYETQLEAQREARLQVARATRACNKLVEFVADPPTIDLDET